MKPPKQLFEEYKASVFPGIQLHPTQVRELALAFYAGMMSIMTEMLSTHEDHEEEEMEDFMIQLAQAAQETNGVF